MPIDPLTALGLTNTVIGLGKSIFAGNQLSKLHRQKFPEYTETPEQKSSRLRAEVMSRHGYTPEETSAFQQKLAQSNNTAFQKSIDRAPGLSQQILSGINYGNVNALNEFASRDANLHRSNIRYADSFSKYLQELNNKNIAVQQENRLMAERALGGGLRDSIGIATQGVNQLALGLSDPNRLYDQPPVPDEG